VCVRIAWRAVLLCTSSSSLGLMNVSALLEMLRKLEVATHQPQLRADRHALARLLHPNFFEVGRSGAV